MLSLKKTKSYYSNCTEPLAFLWKLIVAWEDVLVVANWKSELRSRSIILDNVNACSGLAGYALEKVIVVLGLEGVIDGLND